MIRVVVDTNILIRPLLVPTSSLRWLLESFTFGDIRFIFSPHIMKELITVLKYPRITRKYHISGSELEKLIGHLYTFGTIVYPQEHVTLCRDKKDNMILEAALAGKADFLISSDKDLLALKIYRDTKIVLPSYVHKLLKKK